MAFIVSLKKGHPAGSMQRDGIRVGKNEPVILKKVSKQIRNDPWFIVDRISDDDIPNAIEKGAKCLIDGYVLPEKPEGEDDPNAEGDEDPKGDENPPEPDETGKTDK